MDSRVADYLAEQQQRIEAFRKALTAESDRGCALFAAAHLDASLSDLLYISLVANRDIEKDLFEGTAPLAAFSARIKMAYYLGLISRAIRRDLDIIRAVRNDFAHTLAVVSFDNQQIRDRCKALSFSYHEKQESPRSHFIAAVMGILGRIHAATLTAVPHSEKSDSAPSEETKSEHRKRVAELVNKVRQSLGQEASGE